MNIMKTILEGGRRISLILIYHENHNNTGAFNLEGSTALLIIS